MRLSLEILAESSISECPNDILASGNLGHGERAGSGIPFMPLTQIC
jgi:hypothetical protein